MSAFAGLLLVAVIGPVLLSMLTARQRRAEKEQDYARQDLVAERVADAAERAEAVAVQAREAATLLLAANERVAEATEVAGGKLDAIHALVNSQLTASLQSELNATVRALALHREVGGLLASLGQDPAPETAGEIEAATARVEELRKNLADRAEQTELAYWLVEEYAGKKPPDPATG